MSIPETQLAIWSHQGSIVNSAATANSIKDAINSFTGFPADIGFDVYLSGSYKNDTNIYGESDVDVVVELTSTFYHNLSQQQAKGIGISPATYSTGEFKRSVIHCLEQKFGGANVAVGNKAIVVHPGTSSRLYADVLVCSTFRYYTSLNQSSYIEGVGFVPGNSYLVTKNFPKIHSAKDTTKHQQTYNRFKPTVRIFKNMKKTLINRNAIDTKLAPSYFIECLLFNIPNSLFVNGHWQTVYNILDHLYESSWDDFMCVNGINPLFGTNNETWDLSSGKEFLRRCINLWNEWS
jgi:hypothetical protein